MQHRRYRGLLGREIPRACRATAVRTHNRRVTTARARRVATAPTARTANRTACTRRASTRVGAAGCASTTRTHISTTTDRVTSARISTRSDIGARASAASRCTSALIPTGAANMMRIAAITAASGAHQIGELA
jgi:hypothetical protein